MNNVSAAAAPLPSTGVPATTAVAAPVAGRQAQPVAASAANPTTYNPAPVAGGGLGTDIANAVSRLTAYAQTQMTKTQNEISALFNSEGGAIDAAKLQVYNQKMSMIEMTMQMAAKIQEKEERAIAVWVRP